jgi:hypothetical protein
MRFLLTDYEHFLLKTVLIMTISEHLRFFGKIGGFVQKYARFNLKVPLFVEKRQNKFAHEYKKNKFVFN